MSAVKNVTVAPYSFISANYSAGVDDVLLRTMSAIRNELNENMVFDQVSRRWIIDPYAGTEILMKWIDHITKMRVKMALRRSHSNSNYKTLRSDTAARAMSLFND